MGSGRLTDTRPLVLQRQWNRAGRHQQSFGELNGLPLDLGGAHRGHYERWNGRSIFGPMLQEKGAKWKLADSFCGRLDPYQLIQHN